MPYSQGDGELQNHKFQDKREQEDEGKLSLAEGAVLNEPVKSVTSNLILSNKSKETEYFKAKQSSRSRTTFGDS